MGIVRYVILILSIGFISLSGTAQESKQTYKIDGKKYYLHAVMVGNTLYGISKQYEVSVKDIESANKEILVEGLKVNQTLLIPVNDDNKKTLAPVKQQPNTIIHSVQPKETLFAISKNYDISLEAILEANPEIKADGLKANSNIRIPIKDIETEKLHVEPAKPDSVKGHIVVKGETMYSILKTYDLAEDELLLANPGMDQNLRIGQVVRIPGKTVYPEEIPDARIDDTISDDLFEPTSPDSSGSYRIGLLLPMLPTFPDSSNRHDFEISKVARIGLSYYRGFSYAIDSLDSLYGVNLIVSLFSVSNDSGSLDLAISSPEFDSLDLVIGPFYTSQFERVADLLAEKGVIAICPVNKPSKLLFKRPNTIKTIPSETMQLNSLARYAAAELNDSNLILINSNKFQDTENIDFFKDRYAEAKGVPDTMINDAINEVKLWEVNRETIKMRFPDSGDYVLIVPSENQVFVTKLIGGLYDFSVNNNGSYRFHIYGMPAWKSWESGLDMKKMQRLLVTIPISDHVDFRDYKVDAFYRSYYKNYGFEPDAYTLQAFDLCNYLFAQLSANPTQWFSNPSEYGFDGVMTDYQFVRVLEDSGAENEYIRFYQYNQFRLKQSGEWPQVKSK